MIKRLCTIIKKIIAGFFILYGYNMIASPLGFIIPMNVITVSTVSFLGVPALFSLIFLLIVAF